MHANTKVQTRFGHNRKGGLSDLACPYLSKAGVNAIRRRGKHASDLEGEEEGIIGAAGTACLGDDSVECCQWRSTLRC